MFALKEYQKRTLAVLEDYLLQAKVRGPKEAFTHVVKKNPTDHAPQVYHTRWQLEHVPYVCLRLPTGAGKTLLASHAVQVATTSFLQRDFPFVLWLVPTNTIRKQTVEALCKPDHPYRDPLTAAFGQQGVAVFDIEDINNVRPTDAFNKTCIVVATSQTLRVEDSNKEKRKVYGHNENFEPHFKGLPNTAEGLDRSEDGTVLYSFVNMVHQLRPLVIVDEAHKMVSGLSGKVMERINPACVIEFTATPVESNVLYRVFPSELKAEEMVKLPFILKEHGAWAQAVTDAIATRTRLADLATQDVQGYIRPLVLFQAEKSNQNCTVDVLKSYLLEQGISETEIAIATGEQRELDKIDLFDKQCPVKYVITIEALKEGWDCSFAYVFCSVANISSATDVEQLLGRVMRMPYAKARKNPDLNMAYAHVIAPSFGKAAEGMYDRMLNMGFNAEEAARNIQLRLDGTGGDPWTDTPIGKLTLPTAVAPLIITLPQMPDFSHIAEEELQGVTVEKKGGAVVVTSTGMMPAVVEEQVLKCAKKDQQDEIRREVALHRQRVASAQPPSPSQKNVAFAVPRLLFEVFGSMEWAEPETILQGINWSPLDVLQAGKPVLLPEEFDYDPQGKTYRFDLDGEKLIYKPIEEQAQYTLYALPEQWTELRLSRWLDVKCRQDDVHQAVMLEYCRQCVQSLLERGKMELLELFRAKDALAVIIKNKIALLRKEAQKRGYRQLLFAPTARVEVSFEEAFNFPAYGYAENVAPYVGAYQFQKHFYPRPRDLKSSGEEFRCAQAIDRHPQVKMWVRNVDRQAGSFYLPTSTDKFYPDFVAMLQDGRILLVEYKGQHLLSSDDTKEKCNIGELWASKSEGKGLFMLASDGEASLGFERQMMKQSDGRIVQ